MIKLFDKDTIDFTTLGIGVLKDVISCEVAEKINADFELEMEYPITGQLFNEIRNLRILYLKPNDYTSEQPFRIYSITKPIDGVVTIDAQHVSYDLSGYLFCPKQNAEGEYPIYTKAKDLFDALNAGIQNGEIYPNTCPFRFECSIEEETEGIQISEITNIRKILTSAAEAFEGEYEFDGFTVRMKSKRGSNRGFSVTYSKNMIELEATVNSQGSATGIFPYFKSEETKTVQGITRTWVKVYIAQNGEYPKANWLTDKAENQQAVTPVITSQAYIVTLRPDDPASYKDYEGHIVMWRTTIENSYVIAGFVPDANGNYPYNALSAERDSDISITPVNNHYYRTVSNSVYTYYKFNSTTNKYMKQDNEGEYEDITDQKPVFCFVNQNPTKDSSGETVMDEHYLVDDFGRELNPALDKVYMSSLNEMIGIINHFYRWTTEDFDDATQLWVINGKEKNQNGNYEPDALTATQGSVLPYQPEDGKWYKIFIEESTYEYYRYSSEEGFYMRQTGTGRYKEYPKDTKFEAAPTIISTMSETKTLEHYVDLPEKIIYASGLENDRYQKIAQVDLTEYLNDKLATRVGSTVYEYDQVTINENAVAYSSYWLNVGGEPELDFIAQQITTADKTDENRKNFYGRLFCWNGSNYYEVYSLPRSYLMVNAEKDGDGNYSKTSFCETINSETALVPVNNFVYKILQGTTYLYYRYDASSNVEKFMLMVNVDEKGKRTPMNPSQFSKSEALCIDGEGKSYVEPRRKRILNSAEPSEQELRDAAVKYLEKNDVNVANNTFTVTFAKLSRSPEYSKWKELEHVELGDSISIIYSDLGVVQHEIEVVGMTYDYVNNKYTQVELGNVATSLADTAITSSDGVSVLKNDEGYTDVKKVADIIAENITANYIKAMTAEFTEAQIQQLEATRLDITEALTASQASIDEIVSNLLIADDAVIKNTLTSGEISVKGDISIESGEINLGIIAKFNNQASGIYYKDGNTYKHVYDGVNDIYFNPNTTYYTAVPNQYKFNNNVDYIGTKFGDTFEPVAGTFWDENRTYYMRDDTVQPPVWSQYTIDENNIVNYAHLDTEYVSVDITDNLSEYTDSNYSDYRFTVENTGAMHIKNNDGVSLLDFDDVTGDLTIVGDVSAKDVIAKELLIVGSDSIETADMYYKSPEGLVINEGTINIGGGSFAVDRDGVMDLSRGSIKLGAINTIYRATPMIDGEVSSSPRNNISYLNVSAYYQNQQDTLPIDETFNYSYSITAYDIPEDLTVTADGSIYKGNYGATNTYWIDVSIELYEYQYGDLVPYTNNSGRSLEVSVQITWQVKFENSGEIGTITYGTSATIPPGASTIGVYEDTNIVFNEGDEYQGGHDTFTCLKMFEPESSTYSDVGTITIYANTHDNGNHIRLTRYVYDATLTFVCEASGVEIVEDYTEAYRFVVNDDGELYAASGMLACYSDRLYISDCFIVDENCIIIGNPSANSAYINVGHEDMTIGGGPLNVDTNMQVNQLDISESFNATEGYVETLSTDTLHVGKSTITYDESIDSRIIIETELGDVLRSYNSNLGNPVGYAKKLINVYDCGTNFNAYVYPEDDAYLICDFDYKYKVKMSYTIVVKGYNHEEFNNDTYHFTVESYNVIFELINNKYITVYNPNNVTYYDSSKQYYKYNAETGQYSTIDLQQMLDTYCSVWYTYKKDTYVYVVVNIAQGTSGNQEIWSGGGKVDYHVVRVDLNNVKELQRVWRSNDGSLMTLRWSRENLKAEIVSQPIIPTTSRTVRPELLIRGSIKPSYPTGLTTYDIGDPSARYSSMYTNNMHSKRQFIYINDKEYEIIPICVHNITIGYGNYTFYLTYKSTRTMHEFINYIGFIRDVWYASEDPSNQYYTGRTIDYENTMLRLTDIVGYDPVNYIRYCSVRNDGTSYLHFRVHFNDNEVIGFGEGNINIDHQPEIFTETISFELTTKVSD